jgi:hypothetical protein
MDVIIVDSTCINIVQRASTITTHAMMIVVQKMTRPYVELATGDDFISLAIEMYKHFHSHFDSFLITCA